MFQVNQQLIALEIAASRDDSSEFETILKQLHSCRESERGRIIWRVDNLSEKYRDFDWRSSIEAAEPSPQWILYGLPTQHTIKLEGGLYLQLEEYFRKLNLLMPVSAKGLEALLDGLINKLVKDFLKIAGVL